MIPRRVTSSRRPLVWCLAAVLLLLVPPLPAQDVPGFRRLTDRDAALLRRYLPVLIAARRTADANYQTAVQVIEDMPAWRDSVLAGQIDLPALIARRLGPVPMPPDVVLDLPCSMENADAAIGVGMSYFLRQRLPDAGLATRGVLKVLGEVAQQSVGLADRNVPIMTRWEAFLLRNGYTKVRVGKDVRYDRVTRGDTVRVQILDLSYCNADAEIKALEPALRFRVPLRELRAGRRVQDAEPASIETMLAADGLTDDALTEIASAAALATADARAGSPSAGIPVEFQSAEMRAIFAVREANMAWLARHTATLGTLLADYVKVVR
jgi:hypothetical protein